MSPAMSPNRTSRRMPVCLVLLLLAIAAGAPSRAMATDPQSLPPQGVYEQCGPATNGEKTCLDRLDQIHAAGFEVVLNYMLWYAKAKQVQGYIDHAHTLGMQVIAPMNYVAWRDPATSLKTT